MKKLFHVLMVLVISSIYCFAAEPVKTNEQKIDEAVAYITGTHIRQLKQDKEQCFKSFQGEQAQDCLKGYAHQDEQLSKPAK